MSKKKRTAEEPFTEDDLQLLSHAREAEYGTLKYAFALNGAGLLTVLNILSDYREDGANVAKFIIGGGAIYLGGILLLWLAHTARVLTATALFKRNIKKFKSQASILTFAIGLSFFAFAGGSAYILKGLADVFGIDQSIQSSTINAPDKNLDK